MSRYETIIFDDFSDGEQCDILKPTENSFKLSNNLVIQKNKIKLGPKVQGGVLDNLVIEMTDLKKTAVLKSNYLYILGYGSVSDQIEVRKINVQTGAVSLTHTFTNNGNEAHQLIKFRGKYIASLDDSTYKIQYSTGLTSWTNCGTIGAGEYITDHKIVGDRLYVLLASEKIYYSDDGISFTLLVTLDSNYAHDNLNYLDGYLYVISWKSDGSNNGLIRISLAGEIQDEVVSIGSVYRFESFEFSGSLYILLDWRFLYRVDGVSLEPVFAFENDCRIIFSFGFVDFAFFWDSTNDDIIVMNIWGKFSRPYNIVSAVDYTWMIHKYNNSHTVAVHSVSSVIKASIYEGLKYITPGNIKTCEFKTKGSFVPIQLTVCHKPLTANAWVKVYIKKDGASSWGSAVIDSNVTDAIKKIYDFPTGDNLKTIEFKIEYGTADDSETPEDAELEFIYLPVGLANSK